MTSNYEEVIVLKGILKELKEIKKELGHIGQASIFNKTSTIHVEQDTPNRYEYIPDEEEDPLAEAGLYIKEIIPNKPQ